MFNDRSSLLSHLRTRRSGKPRDMIAPGPSPEQIREIVAIASRTPDHGKLNPWRVVHIPADRREALAALFADAYRRSSPEAGRMEMEAMARMAWEAPELLLVLSSPVEDSKIPRWEQELSCGAFVMNLLHAANATGFVACWLTGWPTFSDVVRDAFGKAPERIAGLVYLGTPGKDLEERPRPEFDRIFSVWSG